LQSLSLICSQLNSGTSKIKETKERSTTIKDKDVLLKTDGDKSGGLSLNPTHQKRLVQLSRLYDSDLTDAYIFIFTHHLFMKTLILMED
jgi:hypothetical protein